MPARLWLAEWLRMGRAWYRLASPPSAGAATLIRRKSTLAGAMSRCRRGNGSPNGGGQAWHRPALPPRPGATNSDPPAVNARRAISQCRRGNGSPNGCGRDRRGTGRRCALRPGARTLICEGSEAGLPESRGPYRFADLRVFPTATSARHLPSRRSCTETGQGLIPSWQAARPCSTTLA